MQVSMSQILKITKSIPIGYYFGKSIPVTVDDKEDTSYCDLGGPRIVIAVKNIMDALSKIEGDFDQGVCETVIRSLVFHEVSHAMLTPYNYNYFLNPNIDQNLVDQILESNHTDYIKCDVNGNYKKYPFKKFVDIKKLHGIVNIAEDARIERMTKNVYQGIDYSKVLELLSPATDYGDRSTKLTAENIYFDLLRYGTLPDALFGGYGNDSAKERHLYLLRAASYLVNAGHTRTAKINVSKWFITDSVNLYLDIVDDVSRISPDTGRSDNSTKNDSESESSSDQFGDSRGVSERTRQIYRKQIVGESRTSGEEGEDQGQASVAYPRLQDIMRKREEEKSASETGLRTALEENSYTQEDKVLLAKLREILSSVKKYDARRNSAAVSYSGVFNPRQAGREDCRFFVSNSASGHEKSGNKINLNLFLDRSGSFYNSTSKVNIMLRALRELQMHTDRFTYTIATIGEGVRSEDVRRFDRLEAYDGTFVDPSAYTCFDKVQRSDCLNYNLVLIDGRVNEKEGFKRDNLSAFNHRNVSVITDQSNQQSFKTYAPDCKLTICYNYADELLRQVIIVLKKMLTSI